MAYKLNDEFISRTSQFPSWGSGEQFLVNGSNVTIPNTTNLVSKLQPSSQELFPTEIKNIEQNKEWGSQAYTQATPPKTDYIALLKKYWYIPVGVVGAYLLFK